MHRILSLSPLKDVSEKIKTLGITALHIKLRATGGNRTKTPGPGQTVVQSVANVVNDTITIFGFSY